MPKLILLTGPGGAGKTTTANKIATESSGIWAHVPQDDIRYFIKAGFAHPAKEWTEQTKKQWDISVKISCDMARDYYKNGVNCIVDGFISHAKFDEWREALAGVKFKLFVLHPTEETTLKRNAQRSGSARLLDETIKSHHDIFKLWQDVPEAVIIDNSNMSVEEVVDKIKSLM